MNLIKSGLTPVVMSFTLLLGACTGEGAAPGSTIRMNPSQTEVSFSVLEANKNVCSALSTQIVINIDSPGEGTGSNGPNGPSGPAGPAGVTDLFITMTHTGQNNPPVPPEIGVQAPPLAFLYEDIDGNGTLDEGIDALVTATGSPAYTTTTNAQGVKVLLLKLITRCVEYSGEMFVFAENKSIVGSYTFDVKQVVEDPPAP